MAHDRLADGSINELIIPNGTFNITAPAEVDVEFFTGKKIFGQSRAGSISRQLTDDAPIHRFCIRLMHSCEFRDLTRSAEHTSELRSLMRIPYAVSCFKQKKQ